jgi:plastocyanin
VGSWRGRLGGGLAAGIAVGVLAVVVPRPTLASTLIAIASYPPTCNTPWTSLNFCFVPETANVMPGDTVTWDNGTTFPHTVTSCTPSACPGEPANTGTDSFDIHLDPGPDLNGHPFGSFVFHSLGTYYYYSKLDGYSGLHGVIIVGPRPTPTPAGTPPPPPTPTPPIPTPLTSTPSPAHTQSTQPAVVLPTPWTPYPESPRPSNVIPTFSQTTQPPTGQQAPESVALQSVADAGGFPLVPVALVAAILASGTGAVLWRRLHSSDGRD